MTWADWLITGGLLLLFLVLSLILTIVYDGGWERDS